VIHADTGVLPVVDGLLAVIRRAYWGSVRPHVRAKQSMYRKRRDTAMEYARVARSPERRSVLAFNARLNHRHWRAFYVRGRELDALKPVYVQRVIDVETDE
jgi:hypothetical protein